jgi:hypothetical protein
MRRVLQSVVVIATLTFPALAHGHGTVRGAEEGAAAGGAAGGPIGAIVGGTVGAATGTVGAILGIDDRPRFREYVVREHVPSYTYREEIQVGTVLPERDVIYREVPAEFHVRPGYRYAVVNDRPVIVEPRTRRVIEIID